MMIVIDDIVQGTTEWFSEKLGKPGASKMDRIITPGGAISKQREGYLFELAAERISRLPTSTYQSQAMLDGIEKEAASRAFYELLYDVQVEQVGMIYQNEDRKFLCSPDGLINREYGLEIKNVFPKTQVGYLLSGKLPNDYFVQIQASMFISGFSRWDFFSTADGLPPLVLAVQRDWKFTAALKVELEAFCTQLDEIEVKLRSLI